MSYIDGFVLPVATADRETYLSVAEQTAAFFKEHGALRLVEGWGDDVPDGKQTDFKRAVNATTEETVCFSFIEWPSKEVRDAAYKALETDPRMTAIAMPFDGKRMIWGGFVPILDV